MMSSFTVTYSRLTTDFGPNNCLYKAPREKVGCKCKPQGLIGITAEMAGKMQQDKVYACRNDECKQHRACLCKPDEDAVPYKCGHTDQRDANAPSNIMACKLDNQWIIAEK